MTSTTNGIETKDHEKEKQRTIGATCTYTQYMQLTVCTTVLPFSLAFIWKCCCCCYYFERCCCCCRCFYDCHHFLKTLALKRAHNKTRLAVEPHTQSDPIVMEYIFEMQLPALSAIFLYTRFCQFPFYFCFVFVCVCVMVFFSAVFSACMQVGVGVS